MTIERKTVRFHFDEEKGLDEEARTFQGFAAVTGNLDDGGDIIKRGAFKKTLAEMGDRVLVYKYHDFYTPIGKPLELREVTKSKLPKALREEFPNADGGLYVKGYISETRDGNDVLTLMRDGVVREMSIGYETMKSEEIDLDGNGDGDGKALHLLELKLYDVSPVPMAMNPAAWIVDVKGLKVEETDDYIHVPVPGESGKHDDHRRRMITISEDEGIQALYCGEDDCLKNVKYIFEKAKGWTKEEAVEWVKEHEKAVDGQPEEALTETLEWLVNLWIAKGESLPPEGQEALEGVINVFEELSVAEPPQGALTIEELGAWALRAELDLRETELIRLQGKGGESDE